MIRSKITTLILLLVLCFGFCFTSSQQVYASAKEVKFDSTDVLEDLKSDSNFDLANYPYYESEEPTIILQSIVEYCYSFKANLRNNYGLYIYVYNPNVLDIETDSKQNKVQIASLYDSYPVTKDSKPMEYEKFQLKFCGYSSGDAYRLFYKFRVVDHKCKDGKTLLEKLNSMERRYDISGIELKIKGNPTSTEFGIGSTFYFKGYSKDYGPDETAESTLSGEIKKLETISLDVKHTFYRSKTSSKGSGYQNQLDTVYFTVPKRYLEEYGKLQRIKAEWYEYKTKDIVVTSNQGLYEAGLEYLGVNVGYDYKSDIGYSIGASCNDKDTIAGAKWGWNLGTYYLHPCCETLYYIFKTSDIDEYDPYADLTSMGGVASNDLYNYILSYNKTFDSGRIEIKDGEVSADLFMSDIDDYRKIDNENGKIQYGYSYYDFDADADIQTLQSWECTNPSFWDNWVNFGLSSAFNGGPDEESKTLAPIQILIEDDLTGDNKAISERLAVNYADVDSIKQEYTIAENEDEVLVLFRFAQSDYYSLPVDIVTIKNWTHDKLDGGQVYMAQESVFLNFDIIQLTFNKDGILTIIPVVASPIDIVSDITPPPVFDEGLTWWQKLLAIIILIFIIYLLIKLLPVILELAIAVIKTVLNWLIGGLKFIFKSRKRRKDKEE